MKYDRCRRGMAYQQFFGDQERFWGWRCIFCGEIIDDVILENLGWLRKGVVSGKKKTGRLFQEGKWSHRYLDSLRER